MSTVVRRFVVCLRAEEADDLQVRKLYEVRSDASAAERGYVRIVDDSWEDYLYPADWFAEVAITRAIERALMTPAPAGPTRVRADKALQRTAPGRRR